MPIAAPIKKGTKLTVDQNYYHNVDGADDYLSSLEYYRIKGTDKWVNLPAIKKSTRIMPNNFALAASTEDNYVIAGNSTYLYNIDGEIVDKSYLLIPDVNVGVDRALYIWNKQTKQADLYYHLTANKNWSGFQLLMEQARLVLRLPATAHMLTKLKIQQILLLKLVM